MRPVSFRLPMEAALIIANEAEKRGLSISTYIRTQVLAGLHQPVDINTRKIRKAA